MQKTITVCYDCHSAIHRLIPKNKDLGRHYNCQEKLLSHEGLATFVEWVRHQK